MSTTEINAKVKELRELRRMADDLAPEIEAVQDSIKSQMDAQGVDTLLCGGIGGGAKTALAQAGIQLYGGVTGSADQAVADLLAGKLVFLPDVLCTHHGEGHGEGLSCGEHGCGGHSCGNHGA